MNNEQNNSIFGVPNPTPTMPDTNQAINQIPGANLQPVSSTTPIAPVEPIIPVQPIPGIVANEPLNNVAPTTDNMASMNVSSTIPSMDTSTSSIIPPMNPENNLNINTPNQELPIESSNPFDIGIGSNNTINTDVAENTNLIQPTLPVNDNLTPSNETIVPSTNNVNNLGDATPLTNESTNYSNNNSNDEVVSVGKYLVHMLLCSIPLVGIIILLLRAFGNKNNKNISNLAKAQLLLSVIMVVISVVITIAFGTVIAGIVNGASSQTDNYDSSYNTNYDFDY